MPCSTPASVLNEIWVRINLDLTRPGPTLICICSHMHMILNIHPLIKMHLFIVMHQFILLHLFISFSRGNVNQLITMNLMLSSNMYIIFIILSWCIYSAVHPDPYLFFISSRSLCTSVHLDPYDHYKMLLIICLSGCI